MANFGLYADDGSMRVTTVDGAGGTGTPVTVTGNVAGGATDSGNPVKVAGVYNSTLPTYTTGQRAELQTSTRGILGVQIASYGGSGSIGAVCINPGDAQSNGNGVLLVGAEGMIYNGSTWDRVKVGPYQLAQTPITASSGNVANASAAATLPGVSAKTTFISGFQVTASGATVGLDVTVTVAGVITGTMSYTYTFPAGALVGAQPLIVTFPYPIPASATNTAIVVTLPAGGAGNTNATVSAQGFQQ